MKKLVLVGFAALSFAFYGCSSDDNGGGGSASDPTQASKEYASPTGTVTNSNATAVANAALSASASSSFAGGASVTNLKSSNTPLLDPKYLSAANQLGDITACEKTSGSGDGATVTFDWKCVASKEDDLKCAGSGTTETTVNKDAKYISTKYNAFYFACGDKDTGPTEKFECNGSSNSTIGSTSVVTCANITCTSNKATNTFNGCQSDEGILLRLEGLSYVVKSGEADGSCANVTAIVKDKSSTKTIVCDVKTKASSCSSIDDVTEVTNCKIVVK